MIMTDSVTAPDAWTSPSTERTLLQTKRKFGKPPQAFINDSEGFRMRAACVCLRSKLEEEVLLVSSSNGQGWIIPGGKVDPTEAHNPAVSAVREAREEAGVVGKLGRFFRGV